MKYLDFLNHFSNFAVISHQDIKNAFQKVNNVQLINWQKQKKLLKLKRGFFTLPNQNIDTHLIANKINYSYISLEYALSYYQIIPDITRVIASVSKNSTEKIKNSFGNFHYHKIKKTLFTGFQLIPTSSSNNQFIRIATPEKALFDLVYFRSDLTEQKDFISLRLQLDPKFNILEIKKYTELIKTNRIKIRLINLINWLYDQLK